MSTPIPFELPFEECRKCMAFAPAVERSDIRLDENMTLQHTDRFYCKGESFCRSREEER